MIKSPRQVVVFNGQLDLIVDTIGTNVWLQKLKWSGLKQYNDAKHKPLYDTGEKPGWLRREEGSSFHSVLRL